MKKFLYKIIFILLCSLLLIVLTSCNVSDSDNSFLHNNSDVFLNQENFVIFFVDVGQGDCIVVKTPENRFILVDSGPNSAESKVINFLDTLGIRKFDVVISTHPHEDHIGNMAEIISKYEVGKFYTINKTTNTKTFEDMLRIIKNKNLRINIIRAFDKIEINGVTFTFLSPFKDYDDLNQLSAVIMIKYKNKRILLTGDISKEVEYDMLNANIDVKADVLKVAHHGSYYATSKSFLKAVNPKVAIISVGKDNLYGHPHRSTIKNLESQHIKIFTTMDNGDVVVVMTRDDELKIYSQK